MSGEGIFIELYEDTWIFFKSLDFKFVGIAEGIQEPLSHLWESQSPPYSGMLIMLECCHNFQEDRKVTMTS